jgi:hypothetical protein
MANAISDDPANRLWLDLSRIGRGPLQELMWPSVAIGCGYHRPLGKWRWIVETKIAVKIFMFACGHRREARLRL